MKSLDLNYISPGSRLPEIANVIVEVPRGRRSKFEVDKTTGLVKLDRYLFSSSHYPGDYGFIPRTLAEDGDALDALIMVNEPTFSGCLIEARIIGLFRMKDGGKNDAKILGMPDSDPLFADYRDIDDVPSHFLREVEHFFLTYKQLEGAEIRSDGWSNAQAAHAEIMICIERWNTMDPNAPTIGRDPYDESDVQPDKKGLTPVKEKNKIIQRIENEIEEWESKLEPLRLKAKLGKMELRDRFDEIEKSVKEKTRPTRTKLKELSDETSEAWRDLAAGCERSWKEAKAAIKSAIERYTD